MKGMNIWHTEPKKRSPTFIVMSYSTVGKFQHRFRHTEKHTILNVKSKKLKLDEISFFSEGQVF